MNYLKIALGMSVCVPSHQTAKISALSGSAQTVRPDGGRFSLVSGLVTVVSDDVADGGVVTVRGVSGSTWHTEKIVLSGTTPVDGLRDFDYVESISLDSAASGDITGGGLTIPSGDLSASSGVYYSTERSFLVSFNTYSSTSADISVYINGVEAANAVNTGSSKFSIPMVIPPFSVLEFVATGSGSLAINYETITC